MDMVVQLSINLVSSDTVLDDAIMRVSSQSWGILQTPGSEKDQMVPDV